MKRRYEDIISSDESVFVDMTQVQTPDLDISQEILEEDSSFVAGTDSSDSECQMCELSFLYTSFCYACNEVRDISCCFGSTMYACKHCVSFEDGILITHIPDHPIFSIGAYDALLEELDPPPPYEGRLVIDLTGDKMREYRI